MARIASRCTNLRELDISYCYEVSHESLVLIGRNCPNLRVLKRNLMNWLDPSQHVGVVPNEYLNACPQDGDSEAAAIGKFMPRLEHLEISFSKLTAKGLTSICDGCLDLVHLDLSGCANLTSRDIVNVTSNLKNLKQINKPNFYIPRSVFHTERYGHWRLYDERFQTDIFRIWSGKLEAVLQFKLSRIWINLHGIWFVMLCRVFTFSPTQLHLWYLFQFHFWHTCLSIHWALLYPSLACSYESQLNHLFLAILTWFSVSLCCGLLFGF